MTTKEVHQQEKESETAIRARELEVFDAFMSRALSIVRKEEDNKSISDACRLADIALKAARGEGAAATANAGDNGVQSLIEELNTGYEKLRAAENQESGKVAL